MESMHTVRVTGKGVLHLQRPLLGKDSDIGDDGSDEIQHEDRTYLAYPLYLPAKPQDSGGSQQEDICSMKFNALVPDCW